MPLLKKIRTSFSIQLSLWVAGFVVAISSVVIGLLASFSEGVIHDETIDTTLQALENTALHIDNTLRQTEMTARLEGRQLQIGRSHIEQLLKENRALKQLRQLLPNAQLHVTSGNSWQETNITGTGNGYWKIVRENREMFVFSKPVSERQYCLTVVCPADDIYGKYAHMHQVLLGWSLGGVSLLIIVLFLIIVRHLHPIHLLADAAQSIANGNLDTPIPDSHYKHESGRLLSSLKKMQRSLKGYMDEMRQKRATLSAQNEELQTAYNEAEAYEARKAKCVADMMRQMAMPVTRVCQYTDTICRDYAGLSQSDMEKLQKSIMNDTEEITALLDQLIKKTADA